MKNIKELFVKKIAVMIPLTVLLAAGIIFGIVTLIMYLQPISRAYALEIPTDSFTLHIGDEADIRWEFPEVTERGYLKHLQGKKQKKIRFESSDESVVTVDGSGHITAVGKGSAEITAAVSDLSGTVRVDSFVRGETLSFEQKIFDMNVGEFLDIPAAVSPSDAVLFDEITYSVSDTDMTKLSAPGQLHALAPGVCHVFADADGLRAEATIRIFQPMRGIRFADVPRGETLHMERGGSLAFPVSFYPENTTDARDLVYTLSDPEMGTVDEEGTLTAAGRGMVTLTVSCGDFSDSVDIEMHVTLSDIQLNHKEWTFNYQEQDQLSYQTVPADTTDNLTCEIWSEDPNVVSVDANGIVTAAYPGTADVVMKVNGIEKHCTYTVLAPVTAVNISAANIVLNPGNTASLSASVVPDFTTEDPFIKWSSENPGIAAVDENGVVTAVSPGRTRIVAAHGDIVNACVVDVRSPRDILAEKIISFGKQFLGTRYVFGGNSLTGGIDCSSYVMQCYASQGIYLPRTSRAQAGRGAVLPMDAAQWLPGDLIYYAPEGYISHVAIYIGDGKILHASQSMGGVAITSYAYNGYVPAAARRVF
ncbi:MAG: Ig-like domain-containing protein [Lachnospiraceae bacterium]|nr:Ig-like domain-containing protein [Lachnospiraceae bacterium]